MEIHIVQLLYLLRPTLNAELVEWRLLGFGFFELAAILLFLALAAAFSLRLLHKTRQPVSGVEVWAALLIVWVTISYVVHIEISMVSTYAKLVIPPATYILLKRILPDQSVHVRMVFLMLVGFLLPLIMSAIRTYQGEGLGQVVYWTGLERYQGVYANINNMGHNAGFAIMATVVYVAFRKSQKLPFFWGELIVLPVVFLVAIYALYASHVRTVYLGLVVFFFITLYLLNKRVLALFIVLAIAFVAYFWSEVATIFYDFVDPPDLGPDREAMGSGRLTMWTWALEAWRQAPLLNQLTGMGVRTPEIHPWSEPTYGTFVDGTLRPWAEPHNDWLSILLLLGVMGLTIFVGLFGSILRAILSIPGKEKFALLGVFVTVVLMNGWSVSYITTFTMFQMFLMLMVYADLKSPEVVKRV